MQKTFEIVLYGATGKTGRQAAFYFAKIKSLQGRWAIAGRNRRKLELLQKQLQEAAGLTIPFILADSQDVEAVNSMAMSARVIVNMAGPYSLYAESIVEACVENSTDYVDITGEAPFVRRLIDRYHEKANEKGVRIIPCCGFDSIPSDIGTLYVVDRIREKFGQSCKSVDTFFEFNGGINRGTVATAVTLSKDQKGLKKASNPFYLNPNPHNPCSAACHSRDQKGPRYDANLKRWTAPFIMASINTRIVRRSYALLESLKEGYGNAFVYHESALVGKRFSFIKATSLSLGLFLYQYLSKFTCVQNWILRKTAKPNFQVSEKKMDEGFFKCLLIGTSDDNRQIRVEFSSEGDPGNRCTTKMVCESALLLIETDREMLPGGRSYGGVLTPAAGLGLGLVQRLRNAGMTIE